MGEGGKEEGEVGEGGGIGRELREEGGGGMEGVRGWEREGGMEGEGRE